MNKSILLAIMLLCVTSALEAKKIRVNNMYTTPLALMVSGPGTPQYNIPMGVSQIDIDEGPVMIIYSSPDGTECEIPYFDLGTVDDLRIANGNVYFGSKSISFECEKR